MMHANVDMPLHFYIYLWIIRAYAHEFELIYILRVRTYSYVHILLERLAIYVRHMEVFHAEGQTLDRLEHDINNWLCKLLTC